MERLTIPQALAQMAACISEPAEIDYNSRSYHEQEAARYNALRVEPTDGIECNICGNKGTIARVIEIDGVFYDEDIPCECMARRRAARNLEKSGMKSAVENVGRYEVKNAWQKLIHDKAVQFVRQLTDKSAPDTARCFFIGGQSGSGKTHISTLICRALIEQGYPLVYRKWTELVDELNDFKNEQRGDTFKQVTEIDVLYMDDVFKPCGGTNYTRQELRTTFEILDRRYCSPSAVTLISSELTLAQIEKLDMATARRIRDMARGQYFVDISPDVGKIYKPY